MRLVPGQVFTSPTPDQMVDAVEAVDGGAGILFIVKNYEGDIMNFDMAREMSVREIQTVITDDDVAVENSLYTTGRRGVAGTLIVEKIVGAAAEEGRRSCRVEGAWRQGQPVHAVHGRGVDKLHRSAAAGKPTFALGDDEMEMGVGIHGEPGRRRVKLQPADAIVDEMVSAILGEFPDAKGGSCLLFVNGFGGTPAMELYLVYNAARLLLEKARGQSGPVHSSVPM